MVLSKRPSNPQLEKEELRQKALAKRVEFRRQHPEADKNLAQHIVNGLSSSRSDKGIWVGYRAARSEADPKLAIEALGGRWAYPKVNGDTLEFYLIDNNTTWEVGAFGIQEPSASTSQQMDIRFAEGILVPGVVFDRIGHRIGSGKAFYDSALAKFSGIRVGIAYSVQLESQSLPVENHDIPMDYLATEKEFLVVKGN